MPRAVGTWLFGHVYRVGRILLLRVPLLARSRSCRAGFEHTVCCRVSSVPVSGLAARCPAWDLNPEPSD